MHHNDLYDSVKTACCEKKFFFNNHAENETGRLVANLLFIKSIHIQIQIDTVVCSIFIF